MSHRAYNANNEEITILEIPESIKKIKSYTFYGLSNLSSVSFHQSLSYIGEYAFCGCNNLTALVIPNASLGDGAFTDCNKIAKIHLGRLRSNLRNVFDNQIEECTLGDNIKDIPESAFDGFENLMKISIPKNVETIGENAFKGCVKLSQVSINSNHIISATYNSDFSIKNYFGSQVQEYVLGDDVNSIGDYAFYNCSFSSIHIPSIVTTIGKRSFSGCTKASTFNLPNSIVKIDDYAFEKCTFESFEISDGLVYLGKYAFSECSRLTSITLPNSLTDIGEGVFQWCWKLNSATLPDGIKSIPKRMFVECYSLASISIPNSVTTIEDEAFDGCSGLTSVTLSSVLTAVGSEAFKDCQELTEITLPSSVSTIGSKAFYGCSKLTSVTYRRYRPIEIDEDIFSNRRKATLYVRSASVDYYKYAEYWKDFKEIKAYEQNVISFADATVKELCVQYWDTNGDRELSVEEAAAVSDIGTIFQGNSTITKFIELYYFTGLTSISNQAFEYCTNLSSIVIPANVRSIGGYAFNHCDNLAELSMPESITSIGNGVLNSCGNLTSVTLPSGITMIPEASFWGCTKLASITIPTGVTFIGASAFRECKALTEIVIPDNVVSIGAFAFNSCNNLSTITVGEKVVTIANNSFLNCAPKKVTINSNSLVSKNYSTSSSLADLFTDKVESYVLGSNITKIGDYAFYKCFQLREIALPSGLTYIGVNAFNYCNYLSSIVIPISVTFLGAGAFNYCSGLTSVTVGWATPLAIGETDFSNRKNATLNVPQGSVSAYKAADYWKEFKNITSGTNVIDLSTATVELSYSESSFSYSGKQIKPTVTSVKINGSAKNISDFNITYGENVNAGNGAIYLNGKNDELYTGTATITFTIGQRDISNATVSDIPAYAYTGSPIQPTFTVTDGNPNIITTNDYSVSYSNNTDPGEATITLTGKNNYKGTKLASFTITSQSEGTDLSTANVELSYSEISFSYIGKQIKPTVTSITVNGATKNVSDFNLTYGDNINAGNGTIFISGKNGDLYSGTATVSFVIYPRHINTVTVSSIPTQEYTGSPIEPTFTVTDGNPSIITTNDYTISYSNNIEPGEATITLTGKNNYKATKKVTFTISQTIIVIDPNDVVVTGVPETVLEGQDPDISKISVSYKEERLIRNLDYEISVNKPNKTITITFIGKYSGQITYNYTEVHVEKIAFADATVKTLCVQYWDTNGDGELSIEEAASVTSIDGVFAYNTSINTFEELQYFTGLKQIGSSAFSDCSGLTSITLPTSIERIERFAFSGCVGITSLSIPEGVQFIGASAFENCSGISVLNLGDNVNTIEENAFRNCSSLTAMVIPNGVTTIEPRTFQYCENLTTVVIPNAVTTIGERAFDGCKALTRATLPGSLKTIGGDAFTDCMFKSVVIPEGVISIGSRAFYHCTSLTSLTLPNSLTEIGYSAFQFASLKNIISNIENPFVIESSVFSTSNYNTATLNVPVGTIEKYRSTAAWNKFVNITDGSTGINGIYDSTSSDEKYYNANGIRQSNLKKGLNIVKSENGQTKKIIIK